MKTRNQIPEQYKWNPSDLVENLETAQKKLREIQEQGKKISSYRGKLGNKTDLLDFLNFTTSIGEELQKLAVLFIFWGF